MRLVKAAEIVQTGVDEVLNCRGFPSERWRSILTNNPMERTNREIRRRTRVVVAFPDGHAELMLVAALLCHVVATKWDTKCYQISGCQHRPQEQRNGLPSKLRFALHVTRRLRVLCDDIVGSSILALVSHGIENAEHNLTC
jgi:hypothetical protein